MGKAKNEAMTAAVANLIGDTEDDLFSPGDESLAVTGIVEDVSILSGMTKEQLKGKLENLVRQQRTANDAVIKAMDTSRRKAVRFHLDGGRVLLVYKNLVEHGELTKLYAELGIPEKTAQRMLKRAQAADAAMVYPYNTPVEDLPATLTQLDTELKLLEATITLPYKPRPVISGITNYLKYVKEKKARDEKFESDIRRLVEELNSLD